MSISTRGKPRGRPEDKNKTGKFVCTGHDNCSRSFDRREHLNRHVRSLHTKQKLFTCTEPKEDGTDCGRTFSRSDNLAQHQQSGLHKKKLPPETLQQNPSGWASVNGTLTESPAVTQPDEPVLFHHHQLQRPTQTETPVPVPLPAYLQQEQASSSKQTEQQTEQDPETDNVPAQTRKRKRNDGNQVEPQRETSKPWQCIVPPKEGEDPCFKFFRDRNTTREHCSIHFPPAVIYQCDVPDCGKTRKQERKMKQHLKDHRKIPNASYTSIQNQNPVIIQEGTHFKNIYQQEGSIPSIPQTITETPVPLPSNIRQEQSLAVVIPHHSPSPVPDAQSPEIVEDEPSNKRIKLNEPEKHKPWKCIIDPETCDKSLGTENGIKAHCKTHFPKSFKFECNVDGCAKKMDQINNMKTHIMRHKDPKCKKIKYDPNPSFSRITITDKINILEGEHYQEINENGDIISSKRRSHNTVSSQAVPSIPDQQIPSEITFSPLSQSPTAEASFPSVLRQQTTELSTEYTQNIPVTDSEEFHPRPVVPDNSSRHSEPIPSLENDFSVPLLQQSATFNDFSSNAFEDVFGSNSQGQNFDFNKFFSNDPMDDLLLDMPSSSTEQKQFSTVANDHTARMDSIPHSEQDSSMMDSSIYNPHLTSSINPQNQKMIDQGTKLVETARKLIHQGNIDQGLQLMEAGDDIIKKGLEASHNQPMASTQPQEYAQPSFGEIFQRGQSGL